MENIFKLKKKKRNNFLFHFVSLAVFRFNYKRDTQISFCLFLKKLFSFIFTIYFSCNLKYFLILYHRIISFYWNALFLNGFVCDKINCLHRLKYIFFKKKKKLLHKMFIFIARKKDEMY